MKNSYADPTANTAIANVDRERRREEMRLKRLEQREHERHLREIGREEGQRTDDEGKIKGKYI